jgi:transcriptional regulator with XRE-family HTH domain
MGTKRLSPEDIEIGAKIRAARQAKGMTQQALATGLELTFQQVQKYEKGTNRVGAARLKQIAQLLGCEFSWFMGGPNEATNGAQNLAARMMALPYGVELALAFCNLGSSRDRHFVLTLADRLGGPRG